MAKITGTTYEDGEITSVFVQALDEKPRLFEPARARGEWLGYECSVCGGFSEYGSENFCPNCGAKMKGE